MTMITADIAPIKTQIREFINQHILFGVDDIEYSDDDSFLESGIIDSMGIMDLTLFVEQQFRLDIRDHEITPANFDSLNRLSAYIQTKASQP
jgi:acyl carrier protein